MGDEASRHQHRVWEAIGPSFDATRDRTWDHVVAFMAGLPDGTRLLDVMAGNGRHAAAASGRLDPVAVDWSRPLLARCAARGIPGVAADATRLPFRDGAFDAAIFVAGLHGIPSPCGREACLQELRRVLRPGAPVQVTVWARSAPRFATVAGEGPVDVIVPWRAGGLDERRTYHLYTRASLEACLAGAGFEDVSVQTVSLAAADDNLVAIATR